MAAKHITLNEYNPSFGVQGIVNFYYYNYKLPDYGACYIVLFTTDQSQYPVTLKSYSLSDSSGTVLASSSTSVSTTESSTDLNIPLVTLDAGTYTLTAISQIDSQSTVTSTKTFSVLKVESFGISADCGELG